MDVRGLVLIAAVLGAGVLGSTTACSGPDPGSITFSERPSTGGQDSTSTSSGSTGSTPTPTDSGVAGEPIFGGRTFAYADPGVRANAEAAAQHAGTVVGKDCVVSGCHGTGAAADKVWVIGGTVFPSATATAGVAKAEVRVVGPDGAEVATAYTDQDGNFWLNTGKPIPAGSKVGVRKEGGAAPKFMLTPLGPTDSGCSANRANCHGTAATGKVYVP